MRRLFPLCAIVAAIAFQTPLVFAQSNMTESLTITTYYPSPYGVYRNLKLNPTNVEPSGPALSRGVMYYNDTENVIKYRNDTMWLDVGRVNAFSDDKPADAAGAVYYDNSDKSVKYYNGSSWVDIGGGGGGGVGVGWNERADHNLNNTNSGKVIIGGNFPVPNGEALDVSGDMRVMHEPPGDGNTLLYLSRWANSNTAGLIFDTWTGPTDKFHLGILGSPSRFRIDNGTTDFLNVNSIGNVGIGTTNPVVPLQVETKTPASCLMVKNAVGTADQSSAFSILPFGEYLWLTGGVYMNEKGDFVQDAYHATGKNFKFSLSPSEGGRWYASSNFPTVWWDLTGGTSVELWNKYGVVNTGPSSRSLKENFTRLNPDEILQKIDQLEVDRWNYKVQDRSITHIGPVAEDFHRIFKTGDSEKSIPVIDASGVSLAGVKALLQKVNMQQQQIENLQAEIEELKSRLKK